MAAPENGKATCACVGDSNCRQTESECMTDSSGHGRMNVTRKDRKIHVSGYSAPRENRPYQSLCSVPVDELREESHNKPPSRVESALRTLLIGPYQLKFGVPAPIRGRWTLAFSSRAFRARLQKAMRSASILMPDGIPCVLSISITVSLRWTCTYSSRLYCLCMISLSLYLPS